MQRHSTESVLQAVRAVLARELSLAHGLSRAKTARLLSVTPPAISQYVSGKRGGPLVSQIEHDRKHMEFIQQLAKDILQAPPNHPEKVSSLLLKTAEKVTHQVGMQNDWKPPGKVAPAAKNQWVALLRKRLEEEQAAAGGSLKFAQTCEDELMKTVFRQIASDSLRHAETVSVLIHTLERAEAFDVNFPSRESVLKMIEAEESADEADIGTLKHRVSPAARILIESIEADERKHVLLLKGLLRLIEEKEKNAQNGRI